MLLGRKIGMTMKFDQHGRQIPVTLLTAGPCVVVGIKTAEKDGYRAYQLGFEKAKHPNKPIKGQFSKAPFIPRLVREVKTDQQWQLGQMVTVDLFQPGDVVKVTGLSKGKGFAGVVKRHGFAGGPATHGQSDRHRAPGSIGSTTTPGRVFRGKRMAGHAGHQNVTVGGLTVMAVDPLANIMLVSGSVSGATGGLVTVVRSGKVNNFVPLSQEQSTPKED